LQVAQSECVPTHYRRCNALETTGLARLSTLEGPGSRTDDGLGTSAGPRGRQVARSPGRLCVPVGTLSTCRRVRCLVLLSPSPRQGALRTRSTARLSSRHQSRLRSTRSPRGIPCWLSSFARCEGRVPPRRRPVVHLLDHHSSGVQKPN